MSNSKPVDPAEDARIKAWRAERLRIAEQDKAERLRLKQKDVDTSSQNAGEAQKTAVLTLLSSAHSAPEEAQASSDITRPIAPASARFGNAALLLTLVALPMLLLTLYLFLIATPLYEARSVIAITKPSPSGNDARSGILGGVRGPSNLPEVFRAHTFVESQAMMNALEADMGLVTEFSGPAIDPLKRLRSVPVLSLNKSAQFSRFVESSVDIQSGLMTLYVRAPSEAQAVEVSQAVLRNTQNQVFSLGQQVFDQRQTHAAGVRKAAEQQVADAQAALVALQIKYQEVDPKNRIEGIYTTIRDLEAEALRLNSEVQKAEIDGIGDSPQARKMAELEARLREQIEEHRASLVAADSGSVGSLNTSLMEHELAKVELDLARDAVQTALKSQADAGREAALNHSLFQVVVPPAAVHSAVYPRIPGTLALALVICLAVYSAAAMLRATRT